MHLKFIWSISANPWSCVAVQERCCCAGAVFHSLWAHRGPVKPASQWQRPVWASHSPSLFPQSQTLTQSRPQRPVAQATSGGRRTQIKHLSKRTDNNTHVWLTSPAAVARPAWRTRAASAYSMAASSIITDTSELTARTEASRGTRWTQTHSANTSYRTDVFEIYSLFWHNVPMNPGAQTHEPLRRSQRAPFSHAGHHSWHPAPQRPSAHSDAEIYHTALWSEVYLTGNVLFWVDLTHYTVYRGSWTDTLSVHTAYPPKN